MRLPDFLVIGAAKSGTISLYHYLAQHPQIFMCPVNETNFFALERADFSRNFQGPLDRHYLDRHCIKELETYAGLFTAARQGQRLGECSPLYLYDAQAAGRIRHHLPAVKLIAILRRPESRAYSNYRHFRRAGIEPLETFAQALEAEPGRIAAGWGPWPFWHYRQMGFYAAQLSRYFSLFDRGQLFICLFDDLKVDPAQLLRRIYAFLDVDPAFTPDVSTRYNLGGQPRSNLVQNLLTSESGLKMLGKRALPEGLRRRTRLALLRWNTVVPALEPELKEDLRRGYQDDLSQLQDLLQRDLADWGI